MGRQLLLLMLLALLVGTLNLASRVEKAKASGTIYIRADGSIDPRDAPISTVDNVTYTLTGNVTSDADGIVVERDNIVIDGVGYNLQGRGAYESRGIDLSGRENVTVRNTQIQDFYYVIVLSYSSNNSISGNNITNNSEGIFLYSSSNNGISGNNITNSSVCGLGLSYYSDHNIISGNNITNNGGYGIWLGFSSNNNIDGNTVSDNSWCGIRLGDSSNNSISGNNITNNSPGIRLESSSNYNRMSGNNITNNDYYGIELDYSSNNTVCHNSINNTFQVNSGNSANVWDDGYPSGGNYWSDYVGTDANHDGIGDTAYVIDANNTDHYPLVTPYIIPEFPSFLILSLFFIATLLAVTIRTRKKDK